MIRDHSRNGNGNGLASVKTITQPDLKSQLTPRSIRGKDSLIATVNQGLQTCEDLIHELESEDELGGIEIYSLYNELAQVTESLEELIEPLIEIEQAIHSMKAEAGDFDRYADLEERIHFFESRNDNESARRLKDDGGEPLEIFLANKPKIDEMINQARELRATFLAQKHKLESLKFNLLRKQLTSRAERLLRTIETCPAPDRKWKEYQTLLMGWSNTPPCPVDGELADGPAEKRIQHLESELAEIEQAIDSKLLKNLELLKRIQPIILQASN